MENPYPYLSLEIKSLHTDGNPKYGTKKIPVDILQYPDKNIEDIKHHIPGVGYHILPRKKTDLYRGKDKTVYQKKHRGHTNPNDMIPKKREGVYHISPPQSGINEYQSMACPLFACETHPSK